MATGKLVAGTRTSVTVTGLGTLASATYVQSNDIDCTTNSPVDVAIELEVATTNTPAGSKQAVVFAQASYDGANYQTGPTSGTTTTDEPDLTLLGVVPMNTASTTHRKSFSLASAYGGIVPAHVKIVIKNDLGVALTSGALYKTEYSYTVA